jgi:hypothetical protein
MRLIKMTIHYIKMKWYFQLWHKVSKMNNQEWHDKFYFHAEQIKELSRNGV